MLRRVTSSTLAMARQASHNYLQLPYGQRRIYLRTGWAHPPYGVEEVRRFIRVLIRDGYAWRYAIRLVAWSTDSQCSAR